jgi:phage terminase small subunit
MATDRQEKAVQIYIENRGKSVGAAMKEAGYSEATARNPKT